MYIGTERMNRTKSKNRLVTLVVCATASLLCVAFLQIRIAAAAGAVEMQVARIVNTAVEGYNGAMQTGDTERWLKYFTDNVHRHGPRSSQEGKQAFTEYYLREFETFQARWTTRHMVISGRSGAVEFEWEAVHKASGTPLKVDMVAVFELASSGKFESVNFYFDTAKLGDYAVAVGDLK
jgi:predicted SnoaL-like aldol condensation-catalyzing enzyme